VFDDGSVGGHRPWRGFCSFGHDGKYESSGVRIAGAYSHIYGTCSLWRFTTSPGYSLPPVVARIFDLTLRAGSMSDSVGVLYLGSVKNIDCQVKPMAFS
jgi:hypothetical protein